MKLSLRRKSTRKKKTNLIEFSTKSIAWPRNFPMVIHSVMGRMVMKFQCGVAMIIWELVIILKSWHLSGIYQYFSDTFVLYRQGSQLQYVASIGRKLTTRLFKFQRNDGGVWCWSRWNSKYFREQQVSWNAGGTSSQAAPERGWPRVHLVLRCK